LKRLKKLTFSFFPGNLHKKNLQIFVFFWCPVSFFGRSEPLDLLKRFYSLMWPI
jgi:hypothetical protein